MDKIIGYVTSNYKLIIALVVTFIVTYVPVIIAFIKSVKSGKSVKQSLDDAKTLASIQDYCIQCCVEAEGLTTGVSQLKVKTMDFSNLKLNTVLTKINQRCIEMGYLYNEDYWTAYIKAYIATTKVVNAV